MFSPHVKLFRSHRPHGRARRPGTSRMFPGLLAFALAAAPAAAQTLTGPFAPFNSWWIHPTQGTGGVSRNASSIFIDRDGDGATDATYNIPNLGPQAFPVNLQLSPTRDILLAFGGSCPGGGTPVYFFDTSNPPNLTIIDNACIDGGIGDLGFYDTYLCAPTGVGGVGLVCPPAAVSPQRVAYVRDANSFGRNQVYWFDLVSGMHRTTFPGFNNGFPFHRIHVSPYGDVAFVQHGATGSAPPSSDYTLVNLCPGPAFGTAMTSNVGGALFNLPAPAAAAEMIENGGDFFIRVTHPALTSGADEFPFAPCGGPPPDDTGACCMSEGGCTEETLTQCEAMGGNWSGPGSTCADCNLPGACCFASFCLAGLTETECAALPGGSWLGSLSTCQDCDILDLDITKTAPAPAVQEGIVLEYTLSYSNVGDLAATGMVITDVIPNGSTYVSSSNGGSFNANTRTVTWNIPGTLAPGGAGSVQLQVRANCGVTSLQNFNYRIVANGTPFAGSPSVTTPVTPADSDPMALSVSSVPARDPLQRGDLVTHTITLEETANTARTAVNFSCNAGPNAGFDAVVDAGGGVATISGNQLTWTGPVGSGATVQVVFTTRVSDCTTSFNSNTWLNHGSPIQLRNPCGISLVEATPPGPFDIIRPVHVEMFALPPIGPPQSTAIGSIATQVFRPGTDLDVQFILTNQLPEAQPDVSISVSLPADFSPAGNPPFIAPTDPGASYDGTARTITWTGPIAGNTSVRVTFRVATAAGQCRNLLPISGRTGDCNDLFASLTLLAVPEPPADPHLLGLFANSGFEARLWTLRPGLDAASNILMCIGHEILYSATRTPGGDIWVMGLPMFRINPDTLDFEIFPDDLAETFGIQPFGYLTRAAFDPADSAMLIAGSNQGVGNRQLKIVRFHPDSRAWSMVFDGAELSPQVFGDGHEGLVVDPDGRIAAVGFIEGLGARILRIDPTDPAAYQAFAPANIPIPTTIALGRDGNYLVANSSFGIQPLAVARLDRLLGTETVLVPNLRALGPAFNYLYSMTEGPDGILYASVATDFADPTIAIDLDPVPALVPISADLSVGVQWIDSAADPDVPGDIDGDGDVDEDDYNLLVAAFGTSSGEPGYDPEADLDGDGDVDCNDIFRFRAEWDIPTHPRFPRCLSAHQRVAAPAGTGAAGASQSAAPQAAPFPVEACGPGVLSAGVALIAPALAIGRARRRNSRASGGPAEIDIGPTGPY